MVRWLNGQNLLFQSMMRGQSSTIEDQAMKSFTSEELQGIRNQHEAWLNALPGVVGTGIGMDQRGRISLKVFSNRMSAETRNAIVERLGAIPVAIEETGEIRKQATPRI
jgi:hypothetical protein